MNKVPDIDVHLPPYSLILTPVVSLKYILNQLFFNIRTYFILSYQSRRNSSNLAIQNPQIEENVYQTFCFTARGCIRPAIDGFYFFFKILI